MAKLGRLLLLAILSLYLVQAAQASLRFWINPTSPFVHDNFVAHELHFAQPVRSPIIGILRAARPLNACTPVRGAPDQYPLSVLLIQGGDCDIQIKVRNAQAAGYGAAVLYTDEDDVEATAASGSASGIPAISISQKAGMASAQYALNRGCAINDAGHRIAFRMIVLFLVGMLVLTVSFGVAMVFQAHYRDVGLIRATSRWPARIRHRYPAGVMDIELALGPALGLRNLHMASSDVDDNEDEETLSMTQVEAQCPVVVYEELKKDDDGAAGCCVICLDEYAQGIKLRSLPCHHVFHAKCIEKWLTTQKSVCPICNQKLKPAIEPARS